MSGVQLQEAVRDLMDDTGITYRQLDYWCKRGWLLPVGQGEGSGNTRWWPSIELDVARRIAELVAEGYRTEVAAKKAREQVTR